MSKVLAFAAMALVVVLAGCTGTKVEKPLAQAIWSTEAYSKVKSGFDSDFDPSNYAKVWVQAKPGEIAVRFSTDDGSPITFKADDQHHAFRRIPSTVRYPNSKGTLQVREVYLCRGSELIDQAELRW